jgi:hypothetical protein
LVFLDLASPVAAALTIVSAAVAAAGSVVSDAVAFGGNFSKLDHSFTCSSSGR